MAKAYGLSEKDMLLLKDMASWYRKRVANRARVPVSELDTFPGPDGEVILSPAGGIPALVPGAPDEPGVAAECQVFDVVKEELIESSASPLTVYNVSDSEISEGSYALVRRTRRGLWVVDQPSTLEAAPGFTEVPSGSLAVTSGSGIITVPPPNNLESLFLLAFDNIGAGFLAPDNFVNIYYEPSVGGGWWLGYCVIDEDDTDYIFAAPSAGSFEINFSILENTTVERIAIGTGTGTTLTAPTITSLGSGRTLVVVGFEVSSAPASPPSGMTAFGQPSIDFIQFWKQSVGAGATGTRTTTISSQAWTGISIIFGPGNRTSGITSEGDTIFHGLVASIGAGAPPITENYEEVVDTSGQTLASADGTYVDSTNLALTLPEAGDYLVHVTIRGLVNFSAGPAAFISARLNLNGSSLTDSETMVVRGGITGQNFWGSASFSRFITAAGAHIIKVQVKRDGGATWTTSSLPADVHGKASLSYLKIGR